MARPRKSSLKQPRNVDKGGIEADPAQALRRAPLRESYGARSGDSPEQAGTPQTIAAGKGKRGKPNT
jgi:hypothetical protein